MIPIITQNDLLLLNELSSRLFNGNKMSSNASEDELKQFKHIKSKLKQIANSVKSKYDSEYGKLDVSISSGNPIAIGGIRLNRLWSGVYKGAINKQYAAQISFVMDPKNPCIDLGFFFGRASAHSLSKDQKIELENRLKLIGRTVANEIRTDENINSQFETLIESGFHTYTAGKRVSTDEWLNNINSNPKESQIVYKLEANKEGYIELTDIYHYVNMLIFLLGIVPSVENTYGQKFKKPLTAEQRAEQAKNRTLIGQKGEIFVFENEKIRLESLKIDPSKKLKHVARISDKYGYDILSCDNSGNEIFIEVKTTTRTKSDNKAHIFHMSNNEYKFYKKNKLKYRVYRVYDIKGEHPEIVNVNMDSLEFNTDSYLVEIKTA